MSDEADDPGEGWWLLAECRGLTTADRDDIFFPARGQATAPAKAICRVCPVREQCLDEVRADDAVLTMILMPIRIV